MVEKQKINCYNKVIEEPIRCECGKVVAYTDGEYVIIMCRGCKRKIKIKLNK